jgi:AAA domain-containing protein
MNKNKEDFFTHPVFDPFSLQIQTYQVETLYSKVMNWIWSGLPGAFIVGDARVGKSTAIEMMLDKFYNQCHDSIEAHWIVIPKRDTNTVKAAYYCINRALGLGINNRNTADVIAERIIEYLAEQAYFSPSKSVILFIDEFQRLNTSQLQIFAEIYDQMRIARLYVHVFFIANRQESTLLLENIEDPVNSHIKGRFFTQFHNFKGFTNVDEIRYALNQYDVLKFPEKTGPTYTEFFLPDDFANGFRLKLLAEDIWRIYREYFGKKFKISSWPAQYYFNTINTLLTNYLYQEGTKRFDDGMVLDAINSSNLTPNTAKIK